MTAWFNFLTDELIFQLSEYSDQDWVGIPCEIRLCDMLLGLICAAFLGPLQAVCYLLTGVLLYVPLCVYGYMHVAQRTEEYGLDARSIRRKPIWVVTAAFLALLWPLVALVLCLLLPIIGLFLGLKSGFVVYWTLSPRWVGRGGTLCNTDLSEDLYDLHGPGVLDRDYGTGKGLPDPASDGGSEGGSNAA